MEFYILDTETTGLNPNFHDIIEYSFIRINNKRQLTKTIKALNPKNASLDGLRITNRQLSDLYKGISIYEAADDLFSFLSEDNVDKKSRCLIGHNIQFDINFLKSMLNKCKLGFPFSYCIDTVPLMRLYCKKNNIPSKRVGLENSLNIMKIAKVGDLHTAKGDARNTYFLWKELLKTFNYLDYIKSIKDDNEERADKEEEEDIQ